VDPAGRWAWEPLRDLVLAGLEAGGLRRGADAESLRRAAEELAAAGTRCAPVDVEVTNTWCGGSALRFTRRRERSSGPTPSMPDPRYRVSGAAALGAH
jgi:hypothetical protein